MKYNKEILNRFLTEKVAIAVRTQEECKEFMELLERETDAKWRTPEKPTQFSWWGKYREETSIAYQFDGSRFLGFGSCGIYKEFGYEIIEFKELIKEKEMNLADKLRFLADRWEDGKDFYIDTIKCSLNSGKLVQEGLSIGRNININNLVHLNLKLAPQWTFTEDEKVILRNLPEKFTWLARCEDDDLIFFTEKPNKKNKYWGFPNIKCECLYSPFKTHLFQQIQWSDEEPCEFRRYL